MMTLEALRKIRDELENKIVNNYISHIAVINSHDLLISFSLCRQEKLFISLAHQSPFLSLVSTDQSFPTLTGMLNDTLRREIKNGLIKKIAILNDDRVLALTIEKTNDVFEKETKTLIVELIPMKVNLIILDNQQKILFAHHYTSLDSVRPIVKGLSYQSLDKGKSFTDHKEECDLSLLKAKAHELLMTANQKRYKEKYHPLFNYLKSHLKALDKKCLVLEKESDKARENLRYLDDGNALLSFLNDPLSLQDYLTNHHLEIDERLSVGQNANLFFKKYKKAKRTIEMNHLEEEKARHEIEKYLVLSSQAQYMNDEELYQLAKELMPLKFKGLKEKTIPSSSYSYIVVDGTKIFFGKNAKQNEALSFHKAKKEDYFFHIKDYSGSHVIINNAHPTQKMMLIAGEICLILSNQTMGDVQYCPIKNIKKGPKTGQVILSNYQLITLKNINQETKDLLSQYRTEN